MMDSRLAHRPLAAVALAALVVAGSGCSLRSGAVDETGRPRSTRIEFVELWGETILDMGRYPVVPPSEDVYVGDVYALPTAPGSGAPTTEAGLRALATPRWTSLELLPLLEEEYSKRPSWNEETATRAEDDGSNGSIYRSGRVPGRHRFVGLGATSNLTVDSANLDPFIPIEIAPLIEGPATPDRYSVSLQMREAESYAISLEPLVDALLLEEQSEEEPEGGQGETVYRLREEHRPGLPLVADPNTGIVNLLVISEVLYFRSLEVTVRRKLGLVEAQVDGPVGPSLDGMRGADAILAAQEMNEALAESGIGDRIGGSIEIVMATDNALTLRRSWTHPLAMAVRGLTLEVDTASGEVLRVAPIGLPLPLPALPEPATEGDLGPGSGADGVPGDGAGAEGPAPTDAVSTGAVPTGG
ncbi:MAG: hypothetical protein AAGB93_23630 [Planctomycetota bacterium]